MARNRMIKPEFWTSEQVVECSPIARLLFIGLWNFCDDAGRHPASVKRLKMEVFPADEFAPGAIQGYIDELVTVGLLLSYVVDDKGFWQVTGWHHQKIDKPWVRYPPPNASDGDSTTDRRPIDDRSAPKSNQSKRNESKVIESKSRKGRLRARTRDQKEIDWNEARASAHRYSQRVVDFIEWTPANWRLLLQACALVQLDRLSERCLVDSLEGLKQASRKPDPKKRPRRPGAYLTKCLTTKAEEDGNDFTALRASITVPLGIMQRKGEGES